MSEWANLLGSVLGIVLAPVVCVFWMALPYFILKAIDVLLLGLPSRLLRWLSTRNHP